MMQYASGGEYQLVFSVDGNPGLKMNKCCATAHLELEDEVSWGFATYKIPQRLMRKFSPEAVVATQTENAAVSYLFYTFLLDWCYIIFMISMKKMLYFNVKKIN